MDQELIVFCCSWVVLLGCMGYMTLKYLKYRNGSYGMYRKYLIIAFYVYLVALLFLTLFRFPSVNRSYSLDPFYELRRILDVEPCFILRDKYVSRHLWHMVANVNLFIPFGVFHCELIHKHHRNAKRLALLAMGISLVIELTQLVFKLGFFQVSDVINNTLGAIVGYAIYKVVRHVVSKRLYARWRKLTANKRYI